MTCYHSARFTRRHRGITDAERPQTQAPPQRFSMQAMTASGMDEKVIDNLFKKFIKAIPKWGEWIDVSFLPEEMKGKYKALIAERIKQLT